MADLRLPPPLECGLYLEHRDVVRLRVGDMAYYVSVTDADFALGRFHGEIQRALPYAEAVAAYDNPVQHQYPCASVTITQESGEPHERLRAFACIQIDMDFAPHPLPHKETP